MATNPATVDDLNANALRTLTAQEQTVGTRKLRKAWGIILQFVPSISSRLDEPRPEDLPEEEQSPAEILRDLVIDTQCDMVLRFLNNPDGLLEEKGDDYEYRRDSATSTGAVYITEGEIALLGAGDSVSETAFSIKPDYAGPTITEPEFRDVQTFDPGSGW
ncbi:MAG: lysyl-tRNA synthetase [Rhodoglobus sp.]|nr:lysyl-tRNA synthetase [Rhodoglobus sp.]